jgi:hypothetical protein
MRIRFVEMNIACPHENMLALEKAAKSYAQQLLIENCDCLVEVKMFKDHYGATYDASKFNLRGQAVKRAKDHFVIEIVVSNYSITEQAITLAHEMVHVKQHLLDGLKIDNRIPYHERPWEIEARAKQEGLFFNFFNEWVKK